MISISEIKLRLSDKKRTKEETHALLVKKASSLLRIKPERIHTLTILRHSLDARKKETLLDVYTVCVTLLDKQGKPLSDTEEARIVKYVNRNRVLQYEPKRFAIPAVSHPVTDADRPLIVGSGPAGLLCAYTLAKSGLRPVLLERGTSIDERMHDVSGFFADGKLSPQSNIQFGEGGAGTFSDGKLYTGAKDREGLFSEVKRIFVSHGAPEDILYEANAHIGTDYLSGMIRSMREEIASSGGEVRFETRMTDILTKDTVTGEKQIQGILCGEEELLSSRVVLAIGHSARDTFRMLYENGVRMEAKPFAVGVRIMHPQESVNRAMYGDACPDYLEPAHYKYVTKTKSGKSVYTFCMCPGGYVLNASSTPGALCVNGMSYRDRGGKYANSAVIVAVTPETCGCYTEAPVDALTCLRFQEKIEEKAFAVGQGAIPVETFDAFRKRDDAFMQKTLPDEKEVEQAVKGAFRFAPVHTILPEDMTTELAEGIGRMGELMNGFDAPDALVAGIESRTSSPVRILRDQSLQAQGIKGLYPCGEGAGYAGGILSSAADGLRVAQALLANL